MYKKLRQKLNMNLWKNIEDLIDWLKSINERQPCKFVIFDIKDFYPSIKESLLKQSLNFAENYIKVSNEDKSIINMRQNLYCSTGNKPGLKMKANYLISRCVHMRFGNLSEFL